MAYYIAYKGKRYGQPMTREQADAAIIRLGRLFVGLEIVRFDPSSEELHAWPSADREGSQ